MLLKVEDVDLDVDWSDVLEGELEADVVFDLEFLGVGGQDSDLSLLTEGLELLLGEVVEGVLDWLSFEESRFHL